MFQIQADIQEDLLKNKKDSEESEETANEITASQSIQNVNPNETLFILSLIHI